MPDPAAKPDTTTQSHADEASISERFCPICREALPYTASPPCQNCGRDYDPNDEATTSPHNAAFCKACHYNLVGIDTSACPECAAPYDPLDPKTYATAPAKPIRRDRVFKLLAAVALIISAILLAQHTILPRPAIRTSGQWVFTVWLWLSKPYGVFHTSPAPNGIRVHYWAGKVHRVEGDIADSTAPNGIAEAYAIEREGDEWTLEVHREGIAWQAVMNAFNTTRTKEDVTGVRILPDVEQFPEAPFATPGELTSPPYNLSTGSFTVTGDHIAIIQALVDNYRLTIEPGFTAADPEHCWMLNAQGVLERVTVEEAREMGHRVNFISGNAIYRMLPRLR